VAGGPLRLLRRRSEFSARGPIPPWWRRPGVLAVVGLLVVGGGLAASGSVIGLVSSRAVRATTLEVRAMALPASLTEWRAACGVWGIRCARSEEPPALAVEAVAEALRGHGYEVSPARCGTSARIDPGTTLAAVNRHESQCTTTTTVAGGELTIAAWDHVPSGFGGAGFDLGRTALVIEWDGEGTERLLVAEPGLEAARFGDVRMTPEELDALPAPLGAAECVGFDADGCQGYETTLEGPGSERGLVEAWAERLVDAEFLVTAFDCSPGGELVVCGLSAEKAREGLEMTRIIVRIDLDTSEPGRARAHLFTG